MRRLLVIAFSASLPLAACAGGPRASHVSPALGGSVIDIDRGTGSLDMPWSGGTAGSPETTGIASTGWSNELPSAYDVVPPGPAPESRRNMVAGPITPRTTQADKVRRVQQALRERGYFQGPVNGVPDPALTGALRRFQADHGLPMSGQLDTQTAAALDILPPPSAPPPTPSAG